MQLTVRTVGFDGKGVVRVLNIQRLFVAPSYSVISLGEVHSRFTTKKIPQNKKLNQPCSSLEIEAKGNVMKGKEVEIKRLCCLSIY